MARKKLTGDGCHNCDLVEKRGQHRGPWRCAWVMPPIDLPYSVVAAVNYLPLRPQVAVWADDGQGCATWKPQGEAS